MSREQCRVVHYPRYPPNASLITIRDCLWSNLSFGFELPSTFRPDLTRD